MPLCVSSVRVRARSSCDGNDDLCKIIPDEAFQTRMRAVPGTVQETVVQYSGDDQDGRIRRRLLPAKMRDRVQAEGSRSVGLQTWKATQGRLVRSLRDGLLHAAKP